MSLCPQFFRSIETVSSCFIEPFYWPFLKRYRLSNPRSAPVCKPSSHRAGNVESTVITTRVQRHAQDARPVTDFEIDLGFVVQVQHVVFPDMMRLAKGFFQGDGDNNGCLLFIRKANLPHGYYVPRHSS